MTTNHHSSRLPDQIQLLEKENKMLRRKLSANKKDLERFQVILNSFEEWYYEINLKGDLTYFSPSICKLTGYSENELQGKNYRDYTSPETAKKMFQIYNDIYLTGEPTEILEYEIFGKDGKTIYLEASVYLMHDSNGKRTGFQGFAHDITDRKKMEMTLQESEKRYRLLADNITDVLFTMDMNLNYTYVSPSVKKLRGFEPEELIGTSFFEKAPPAAHETIASLFKKEIDLEASGQSSLERSRSIEVEMFHKDGSTVWIESNVSFLRNETNRPIGIIGINRDITERKKYTKALKDSEARYRLLADNISDTIWIFDLNASRFSYSSPSIEGITGVKAEDVTGFGFEDILTPLSLELANKILAQELAAASRTFDSQRSRRFELEIYRKDGSTVWTETVAKLISDQNHHPIAILGATRDISDRRILQDQLNKSQKMESLGLLAGGVAHDLNNVLSGIISYPELLLMTLPDDSELKKPLKTIMESGNRAAAIVQDLLTIARGVAITKEPIKLNDLVSDYFGSPEFKKLKQFYPGVTFKTNLAEDLLNIDASDVHIRKVLMNLIANATEAVKERGNVSIFTDNRFLDRPLKGYEEIDIGEYAVFAVADNGPGISTRDLKRVFEPFYTKKKMGRSGTGLGLSVVWNVMRDHKGYIDVKSNEDGTLFELYFPISRDVILKKNINLSLTSYQGNGETILVVDDIESQREISSRMVDMLGYKYKAVASGEKAIEFLEQHTVDLILLDMIMEPGINGYETYRRIIKIHPGQKAIILSGFSETDDVKDTQSLGAGKYLKKPITIEKLGMAIKEELAK